VNADYGRQEVQLSGEDLERARGAEADVVASLNSMAGLMIDAVDGPGEREVNVETVSADFGVHVLVVHTPDGCYVYDGKMGVCRPCTPEEEAG
jgi:hypothetical protein